LNRRRQPFQGWLLPRLSVDSTTLSSESLPDFILFIGAKMEPSCKNLSLPRFASISTCKLEHLLAAKDEKLLSELEIRADTHERVRSRPNCYHSERTRLTDRPLKYATRVTPKGAFSRRRDGFVDYQSLHLASKIIVQSCGRRIHSRHF
jgi:hypothetical protein